MDHLVNPIKSDFICNTEDSTKSEIVRPINAT